MAMVPLWRLLIKRRIDSMASSAIALIFTLDLVSGGKLNLILAINMSIC